MNELQLTELTRPEITSWDFAALKVQLAEGLKKYDIVYTDEKEAKADKSELSKIKKAIEDRRKDYKKACLAPYEAIEPQVKELVGMIDERAKHIDETVKAYKAKKQEEKRAEVKAYYDTKSAALGEYADSLFDVFIADSKWLNATCSAKTYKEEILLAVSRAKGEIESIKSMDSPFVSTLLEDYSKGMSLEKVNERNTELTAAAERANMNLTAAPVPEAPKEITADKENGIALKIYADKKQLESLFDFMKAIGVEYEVL